jgi:hypothetical protein
MEPIFLAMLTFLTAVFVVSVGLIVLIANYFTKKRLHEIHLLVNNRMADMESRVAQLTQLLTASDIAIPPPGPRHEIKKDD